MYKCQEHATEYSHKEQINLSLVEAHGFLVEGSSFLARNESFQLQVLSGLHESFGPLGKSISLVSGFSCSELLLGDDLSALGLHKIFLKGKKNF